MIKIKKLSESNYPEYIKLTSEAYPGVGITTADDRARIAERSFATDQSPLCMADF